MSRIHDEFPYENHMGSSSCHVLHESTRVGLHPEGFFVSFYCFMSKCHPRKPPQNRSKTSKLRPPVEELQWCLGWSTGREAAPQVFPGVHTAPRSVAGHSSVLGDRLAVRNLPQNRSKSAKIEIPRLSPNERLVRSAEPRAAP